MSGPFQDLHQTTTLADLVARRVGLEAMAKYLAEAAPDAGEETTALLVLLAKTEMATVAASRRLGPLWKAAELWAGNRGGSHAEAAFLRALADYRGVELPECERCLGSGVVVTGASQRSCTSPNCIGGRDVSPMREAA